MRCLAVLRLPPYLPVCSALSVHTHETNTNVTRHTTSLSTAPFFCLPVVSSRFQWRKQNTPICLYLAAPALDTAADKQSASSRTQLCWRQRRRLLMRSHPQLHKQLSTRYMAHPNRQLAQCSMQGAWAQRNPPAERLCLHSGC